MVKYMVDIDDDTYQKLENLDKKTKKLTALCGLPGEELAQRFPDLEALCKMTQPDPATIRAIRNLPHVSLSVKNYRHKLS